jgi:hypothetical protein
MFRNDNELNSREEMLFENITSLGDLRRESIALKRGVYSTQFANPDLLIYQMSHLEQNMTVILNRGEDTTFDGFSENDIIRFGEASIENSIISIPANSVVVIELFKEISNLPEEIVGCNDTEAINFNPIVTVGDDSCQYKSEIVENSTSELINETGNETLDVNENTTSETINEEGNETSNVDGNSVSDQINENEDQTSGIDDEKLVEDNIESSSSVTTLVRNSLLISLLLAIIALTIVSRKNEN